MPTLPPNRRRSWQPAPAKRVYQQHAARTADYDSPEWKALSRLVRTEQPICAVPGCGKKSAAADHIVPVRLGGGFLDRANLQALCWSHHQSKSAKERHQAPPPADSPPDP